jgi:DNA-binding transcriptional MerR regulator
VAAARDTGPGYLRIGELARRVGVSPELLRAWERRYGVLQPERTAGGFRLYSDADEARVRAMQAHVEQGLSAAEAARLALDSESSPAPSSEPAPASFEASRDLLARALAVFDEVAAQTALDRLFAAFSLDTVIEEVVLPFLHELGRRWERGEATVGQEHFASNVIRGRLMALARGWDQGTGPRAILACAPGEQHDLGLAGHGLALRARGWRISYLGPDTPIDTIRETAETVRPDAIVVAVEMRGHLEPFSDALGQLGKTTRVAIGGRGADEDFAARVGALHLGESPVAAADRLTALHASRAGTR